MKNSLSLKRRNTCVGNFLPPLNSNSYKHNKTSVEKIAKSEFEPVNKIQISFVNLGTPRIKIQTYKLCGNKKKIRRKLGGEEEHYFRSYQDCLEKSKE
jgi:hypothetical protein